MPINNPVILSLIVAEKDKIAALNKNKLPEPSQPRMITKIALGDVSLFSMAIAFSVVKKFIMSTLTETMP